MRTMRSAQMSMYNITESFCEHFCFLLCGCNFSSLSLSSLPSAQNDIICQKNVILNSNGSDTVSVNTWHSAGKQSGLLCFVPTYFSTLIRCSDRYWSWNRDHRIFQKTDIIEDILFAAWFIQQHYSHQFRSLIRNVNFTAFIHAWHCIRIFISQKKSLRWLFFCGGGGGGGGHAHYMGW